MVLVLGTLFLLAASATQSINFGCTIAQIERLCFSEYLDKDTPYTVEVHEDKKQQGILLSILDSRGEELYKSEDKPQQKKTQVVEHAGSHQFCITNNNREEIKVYFKLSFGALKDEKDLTEQQLAAVLA